MFTRVSAEKLALGSPMRNFFFLAFLCFPIISWSNSDDYQMRVSWVKTMKELLQDIEKNNPQDLSHVEKTFLEKFKLIEEAYADSRFDCFYGGWPSKRGTTGKKLCGSPTRTNPDYSKGSCSDGEIQCQPLLFNKGLCVSFRTQEERSRTFSNCEKKFQKEKNGNYDFLKNLTREEAVSLREISTVARDVCGEDSTAPQKGTSICKKILQKVNDGLRAIDRGFVEATAEVVTTPVIPETTIRVISTRAPSSEHKTEDCEEQGHDHGIISMLEHTAEQAAAKTLDDLYDEMKAKFQKSPFCDPMKVMNNPVEKPNAIIMNELANELDALDYIGNRPGSKASHLERYAKKYNLSDEVQREVLPLMNELGPVGSNESQRKSLLAKIKGKILQDVSNHPERWNGFTDRIKEGLAKNHIFSKNSDGTIECPFVSKDAFKKAMQGRENVLRRNGGSISNKDQITIVDYTRPSNERRLFVIDLKSNEVLHNTWVAHGAGGGKSTRGVDGFGSSPEMSNRSGSNLSSDGFIIATSRSSGNRFGPNVLLRGIDSNNSNMAARSVILHGWDSPMRSYSNGLEKYDSRTERFSAPIDVIEKVKRMNFNSSSTSDIEEAIRNVRSSTYTAPYLNPTEGCLGVPVTNSSHLDKKGRNKSQLEMLRDDLPGSIIFNYSGPDMESKFF